MTGRWRAGLGAAMGCFSAASALAQGKTCQLQVDNVDREGMQNKVAGAVNYFAGGNVRMRCRGQEVRIWTDSVASYNGQVVQFIGHFRYEDETASVSSDFGTYYKDNERWEAQGHVQYVGRRDSSRLEGPSARYYRKIKNTREQEELEAVELTLKGAVLFVLGRFYFPLLVISLVPLYYGLRKLAAIRLPERNPAQAALAVASLPWPLVSFQHS